MAAFCVMIDEHPNELATKTAIKSNHIWDHPDEVEKTRALVNGRCQDLLAVIGPQDMHDWDSADPEYLYRIEFLHRSVQDFLNRSESVQRRLEQYAGYADFNVRVTLFACYVFLIKRAYKMIRCEHFCPLSGPRHYIDDWASIAFQRAGRSWSSEAFFHMRSISPGQECASLLKALDGGMQAIYAQVDNGLCHWSNHIVEDPSSYGNPPLDHDLDVTERGNRDLLGHMIELGLTTQVETFFKDDPNISNRKNGRPHLDYALRYKTSAPSKTEHPEELELALAMVNMLLEHKLDVNQKVDIHGGRTVWESYVYFIFDNDLKDGYRRKIAWLLIDHGAEQTDDRVLSVDHKKAPRSNSHDDVVEVGLEMSNQYGSFSVDWMLEQLFGEDEARAMQEAIVANSRKGWLKWLGETLPFSVQNHSPDPVKNFVWEDMSNTIEL
jgi:hypothetical protein